MSDDPSEQGPPDPDTLHPERRHANRVYVEGYELRIGETGYPVLDLSLGGIRIGYDGGDAPLKPGESVAAALAGDLAKPIDLTVQAVWVDEGTKTIGCTFPVLGRNISGELLQILN